MCVLCHEVRHLQFVTRGADKLLCSYVNHHIYMFQAPSVMPFYGANTGPLPPQPGGMVDPGSGFVPPLRDRFPNAVWHPASGADPNNVGG